MSNKHQKSKSLQQAAKLATASYLSCLLAEQEPMVRPIGGGDKDGRKVALVSLSRPEHISESIFFAGMRLIADHIKYATDIQKIETSNVMGGDSYSIVVAPDEAEKLKEGIKAAQAHFTRPNMAHLQYVFAYQQAMRDMFHLMLEAEREDYSTLFDDAMLDIEGLHLPNPALPEYINPLEVLHDLHNIIDGYTGQPLEELGMRLSHNGEIFLHYNKETNVKAVQTELTDQQKDIEGEIARFAKRERLTVKGLRPGLKAESLRILDALCEAELVDDPIARPDGTMSQDGALLLHGMHVEDGHLFDQALDRIVRCVDARRANYVPVEAGALVPSEQQDIFKYELGDSHPLGVDEGTVIVFSPETDVAQLRDWLQVHRDELKNDLTYDFRSSRRVRKNVPKLIEHNRDAQLTEQATDLPEGETDYLDMILRGKDGPSGPRQL